MNPFPPTAYPPEQKEYRLLPRTLFALKGMSTSLRFDNVAYHPVPNAILYDVSEGPGRHEQALWRWVPGEEKETALRIDFYSGHHLTKWQSEELTCVVTDPGAVVRERPVRWLSFGDSLTAPGHYQTQTLALLASVMPKVTVETIGTKETTVGKTVIRHEGRPGWSWHSYLIATTPTYREKSPFLYDDSLDVTRYMKEFHGEKPPDIITLFLGANDVFGIAGGYSYQRVVETVEKAKLLVGKLRLAAPNAQIGLLLPPPPSGQDGFGENYGTGVAAWQYRCALQVYHREMLRAFDGGDDHIAIVPIHLSFDPEASYPREKGKQCNALHPTPAGYQSITEALAAWIAYQVAHAFQN